MKTNLIRIVLTAAAVTALGLSACSAGAENKPAGNTQAVSTTQDADKSTSSPENMATVSSRDDTNITANSDGSGNRSGSKDTSDSGDKPYVEDPNVSSSSGVVTLNGHRDTINTIGSSDQVTFKSADKVILSRSSSTVVDQELDDVEITSNGNGVTVTDDLDEVTISDSDNTVFFQGVEEKKDMGSGNTIP